MMKEDEEKASQSEKTEKVVVSVSLKVLAIIIIAVLAITFIALSELQGFCIKNGAIDEVQPQRLTGYWYINLMDSSGEMYSRNERVVSQICRDSSGIYSWLNPDLELCSWDGEIEFSTDRDFIRDYVTIRSSGFHVSFFEDFYYFHPYDNWTGSQEMVEGRENIRLRQDVTFAKYDQLILIGELQNYGSVLSTGKVYIRPLVKGHRKDDEWGTGELDYYVMAKIEYVNHRWMFAKIANWVRNKR